MKLPSLTTGENTHEMESLEYTRKMGNNYKFLEVSHMYGGHGNDFLPRPEVHGGTEMFRPRDSLRSRGNYMTFGRFFLKVKNTIFIACWKREENNISFQNDK